MDPEQKKILKPLCLALRHDLEGQYDDNATWFGGDLEKRLNSLGVWWDRESLPIETLSLSDDDRKAREMIDAYLSFRYEAEISHKQAFEEYVRETAYSWANRLLILRCMEARGLITDPVIQTKEVYGGRSLVHHRLIQRKPELCAGEDGGLYSMLNAAFEEHAAYLPGIFDPTAPAIVLRPSITTLKKCIGYLSGTEPVTGKIYADDAVFAAPDALGWAYQYWNAEEKDRVFELLRTKKGKKIEGAAEIIPATQLYTESYMVKFLVQNSLGAIWMQMYPDSDLCDTWEYYVRDADRAPVKQKNVSSITFLDPACGSGHFLIEAFDIFYQMYEAEGKETDPDKICKSILSKNLYGIDIDERAVQIARAALWMKASEKKSDFKGRAKNLVATNIRLPKGKDHLQAFLEKHPEDKDLSKALEVIFEGLSHVDELGSLVQIEEPLLRELDAIRKGIGGQATFGGGISGQAELVPAKTTEEYKEWQIGVLNRVREHFDEESEGANPSESFFSRSAAQGLQICDILLQKYDVVTANPPYMSTRNMGVMIKNYISDIYQNGKNDLYLAFIQRCYQLCSNNKYLAMVTMNKWFFLQTFKNIRTFIVNNSNINLVVDIGDHAFSEISGEVVKASLFICRKTIPQKGNFIFIIKLSEFNSTEQKIEMLNKIIKNQYKENLFKISNETIQRIPDYQLLYWFPKEILDLFSDSKISLSNMLDNANCGKTGNNDRYLRFNWEISSSYTEKEKMSRWVQYTKGGKYKKWCGNDEYCIDWREGIQTHYKNDKIARITEKKYWFREGVTFSTTSTNSLSARYVNNSVYDMQGPTFFPINGSIFSLLSILNSSYSSIIVSSLNPTMVFQISDILKIPFKRNQEIEKKLHLLGKFCYDLKKMLTDEYCNNFKLSSLKQKNQERILINFKIMAILHTLEAIIDNNVLESNNISKDLFLNNISSFRAGNYPLLFKYSKIPDLNKYLNQETDQIIQDFLSQECTILEESEDIEPIISKIKTLYESGYSIEDDTDWDSNLYENDEKAGSRIVLPSETFLEDISEKINIHPISLYWILEKGIKEDGWTCKGEERNFLSQIFTGLILRLLGHQWPKQIESGEPLPEWVDDDGIIPFIPDCNEPPLIARIRERIRADGGDVSEEERYFEEVMGISLERWIQEQFFKHHTKQFKKRPIAWHIQSTPVSRRKKPAFSCLMYYQRITSDTLIKIRSHYIGDLILKLETELRGLEESGNLSEQQTWRRDEIRSQLEELSRFDTQLDQIVTHGFESPLLKKIAEREPLDSWTSPDGVKPCPQTSEAFLAQEMKYDPDINDGVRVNIAPLQKAGILVADVLAKKDLEKAIADRAEWREDERRWCREGKLPQCGWWRS